ncbi:CaiB/BaiF CoA-transferase family protein [Geomicrobium sp. JCM 19038]|uniref:CaiB/BaiF CoA transferase family protein n=1 Tax=Geomicrobium sp. JCM 19038 TaxID=1460635 RepID=UPI00045F3CC9|nr:CaiB/BaiF CoA-transferase family protein [Geomicrobium sp. JCM 19038]GAK07967.1 alpha-methylacyl-CoA racemase [Geomicrobium sp. JCM 19038]
MEALLRGIKVLDLTRLLPGPYCTMFLSDHGADVIKVEEPTLGDYGRSTEPIVDGYSARHLSVNRNKRSLSLNLKSEEGKEIFLKLVQDADVVVESFRPGVMKKLGLSYEELTAYKEDLIVCSISGFGQDGPYMKRAGHDLNYIGYAGILGLMGEKGQTPPPPSVQVADLGGGSLMALSAILMALFSRERTGKGQYIDISMLDGALSWLSAIAGGHLEKGDLPQQGEFRLSGVKASYSVYETKDARYMAVAPMEEKFWRRFCELIGREDLIEHLHDSLEGQKQMKEDLQQLFYTKTQKEWTDLLAHEETCVSPVNDIEEVLRDPQVEARNMVIETEHPELGTLKQLASPLKFSGADAQIEREAPTLGQHTDEILSELGYSKETIQHLRQTKLI